jgi:predicted DsbA family dithiol-disulfide isomerase
VTVHVYCRFLSANCAMLRSSLAALREELPDQVRVVFHHMLPEPPPADADADAPATTIPAHRDLITMHRAALCAGEQGAFWELYRLAYQPQTPQHRVLDVDAQITALLPALPVDVERFQTCMSRPGGDEQVRDLVRAAREVGITHTPTVVIDGRAYLGYKSSLDLRALVEEALLPGLLDQAFPTLGEDGARFDRDAQ